ncbi:MAG: hypothetical protein EP329_11685 [Deltaproteobacteria bacterium]|nr:MAG: hypothetical protein EP329_11685 [Deltaproteobacteria bacterium]
MLRPLSLCFALPLLLATACDAAFVAPPSGRLELRVAPLSLPGIVDADYTLTVTNGAGGSGDVVWTRDLTSQQHGDGAGSLSFVGTCDASTGTNTVTLTLTALYDAAGVVATGTYMNPTPVSQEVACVEGADVPVAFDLTIARRAQQGFFDVAMQFSDVFCSAKLDCCRPSVGDTCALDGSDDLLLLSAADGTRARTMVLGFACTTGTEAAATTTLLLDHLALDCNVGSDGSSFVADLTIDPGLASAGNQCEAGAVSGCPAVTEYGAADADTYLFQVAVYRGDELLTSGGADAHKRYWNVALGVNAAISGCTLRTRGTAYDAASALVPSEGADYPYVLWDADLGTCAAEALAFDTPDATLTSAYSPFSLATLMPAPAISYAAGTVTCNVGDPCSVAAPTSTGGPIASLGVAPTLPAGLTLDPATGAISGTPTAGAALTTYTITATNPGGIGEGTVTLEVTSTPSGPNLIPGNTTYIVARNGVEATCAAWQGNTCMQPKLRPQSPTCTSYPYRNDWHAIHFNGEFFCYYASGDRTVVATATATWQGPPTVHAAWSNALCSTTSYQQLHGFTAGQNFSGGTALTWDYGRGAIGTVAVACNW